MIKKDKSIPEKKQFSFRMEKGLEAIPSLLPENKNKHNVWQIKVLDKKTPC